MGTALYLTYGLVSAFLWGCRYGAWPVGVGFGLAGWTFSEMEAEVCNKVQF